MVCQGLGIRESGLTNQVERRAATDVAMQEAPYRRVLSTAGLGLTMQEQLNGSNKNEAKDAKRPR